MILKNKAFACALMVSVFGFTTAAFAAPTITSPYVSEGEAEVEVKGEYNFNEGDDSWGTEVSASYGLTRVWEIEVEVEYEDEGDEEGEFTGVEIENKFQLAPKGQYFVDPGFKLAYAHSLNGGADEVEGVLLLAKTIGDFFNKSEIAVAHEFDHDGEDSETTYHLAYGLYYNYSETFQFGGEFFGDFGDATEKFDDQEHSIGPVAFFELAEGVELETGALIGLTNSAPDATLKAVLEYEF